MCSVVFWCVLLCSVLLCSVVFCCVLLYSLGFCDVLMCSVLFRSIVFWCVHMWSVLLCSVLFKCVVFCFVLLCSLVFTCVVFCCVLFGSDVFWCVLIFTGLQEGAQPGGGGWPHLAKQSPVFHTLWRHAGFRWGGRGGGKALAAWGDAAPVLFRQSSCLGCTVRCCVFSLFVSLLFLFSLCLLFC